MTEIITLEEKSQLVNGGSFFGSAEIPSAGIERMQLLDGGTGMNFEQLFGDFYSSSAIASTNGMIGSTVLQHVIDNYYAPENLNEEELAVYEKIKQQLDVRTGMPDMAPGCFPPGMLLGATFSPETVHEVGRALGLEATAYKVDILLGTPNVNIHRDPLNGRLFEGYSEDPCLVSKLAPELVRGVQEYPVAANVKHFAANNQEMNRIGINETISRRALEEIYFPGFKSCVEAGVMTVMSAYNKINGTACSENEWLLNEILRGNWGFEGMVMSDWGAVYNAVNALAAGNDLAMPGPIDGKPIAEAVREGRLSEEKLNTACKNILSVIEELKSKRAKYSYPTGSDEVISCTDAVALRAALEGIVLLKNKDIFPINGASKVYITGSGRNELLTCGTGSAGITTNRNTSFPIELAQIIGSDRVVVCDKISECTFYDEDVIISVASLSGMEGNDRNDMLLSEYDRKIMSDISIIKAANPEVKTALILNVCGPVELCEFESFIDGIFCIFLPGMMGGRALARLICGLENPSGKLPLTFPEHYRDTPTFINFPGDGRQVNYGEGIFVGYRYYEKKEIEVAYPFAHGLSYTSFEISDVKADKTRFENELTVSGKIKNTGKMAGSEVVMLYISDVVSTLPKPVRELKDFVKIRLEAGEEKEFSFTLDERNFSCFDMDNNAWICEEGYYDIVIEIQGMQDTVRVYKEGSSPYSYGLDSTVKVFYENSELKAALFKCFKSAGLDLGIIESNYQYTPNNTLRKIIPQHIQTEQPDFFKDFLQKVSLVEKI